MCNPFYYLRHFPDVSVIWHNVKCTLLTGLKINLQVRFIFSFKENIKLGIVLSHKIKLHTIYESDNTFLPTWFSKVTSGFESGRREPWKSWFYLTSLGSGNLPRRRPGVAYCCTVRSTVSASSTSCNVRRSRWIQDYNAQ